MSDKTPTKLQKNQVLKIEDASLSDDRIPRNLILMYGDKPYIEKAGLEWKANQLFGAAGFSVEIEPHTIDYDNKRFIFKATVTIMANGQKYVNYGEATRENANSMMQSQLLHLAATRAECRALRMATATGYASYEEVMTMPEKKTVTDPEQEIKPATKDQIENIKNMVSYDTLSPQDKSYWDEQFNGMTFKQAALRMNEIATERGKKK